MVQDIGICLRILGYSTFEIFGILNPETLGEGSGHWNMPKDIGKFNFQEIRDIQDIHDIEHRDIGRRFRTFVCLVFIRFFPRGMAYWMRLQYQLKHPKY